MITEKGKKHIKAIPCGMLYSQGRGYFLLRPEPIVRDSWQGDNCYRFLAVPAGAISSTEGNKNIYAPARHIVTNAFAVDYMGGMPEILIKRADEYDVFDSSVEYKVSPIETTNPEFHRPTTLTIP